MSVSIVAGVVLGFGIAAGLNIYGAVAAIGLASRLGWFELAAGLRGLQSPIVIGPAILLFGLEIYADRSARTQRWWDALHTIVRPLAASSLAAVVLSAAPTPPPAWLWLTATFSAGMVALIVHASKTGARVLLSVARDRRRLRLLARAEDAVAIAFGPLTLARPGDALWIAAAILLALAVFGRWLWRAFLLGPRALAALGAGFFGTRGWLEIDDLPAWAVAALETPRPGQARHRGARASLHGAPGRFRNGWFVTGGGGPRFLFRGSSGRVRVVPLESARCGPVQSDEWVDRMTLGANGASSTLFLLKDGPDPRVVRRLFAPASPAQEG